ncbi:flavin binding monooxygenase, partial [Reticulomyxa filosa]
PGVEKFKGKVLNLPDFKRYSGDNGSKLKDKNVIVIGSGTSAMEMTELCCHLGCQKVLMLYRTPTLLAPFFIPTGDKDNTVMSMDEILNRGADINEIIKQVIPHFRNLSKYGFEMPTHSAP